MAKFINDLVLNQALDYIKQNADKLVVCDGQPSNYTDATTDNGSGGNALGEIAVTTTDFTIADGDTSGRKITVAAQTGIDIDADGTADHIALIDDNNTDLLHVTTLSASQGVSSGGTMDTNAYDEEIEDPS